MQEDHPDDVRRRLDDAVSAMKATLAWSALHDDSSIDAEPPVPGHANDESVEDEAVAPD